MMPIEETTAQRHTAILLLGPTGTGKTPLGNVLALCGWRGQPCLHFDFGANLRELVARSQPDEHISRADLEFLRQVLHSGALLGDEHFPLATKKLQRFMARSGDHAWLALNGLPRHLGQARAMDAIVNVRTMICLESSPETVLARIGTNVGGDRADRTDDDPAAVQRKLEIYHSRSAPLVEHYRRQDATILTVQVTAEMAANQIYEAACAAQR
ncbi:MAG: nucleoside monophosphate kinase [Thermoguttaceae bacterium]